MYFLAATELRAIDDGALEGLLARTELVVAAGAGEVRGLAAAALLFADYAVLDADATLHIDAPQAWAAAAWRIGRGALRLHAGLSVVGCQLSESLRHGEESRTTDNRQPTTPTTAILTSAQAKAEGLCDELIEGDAQAWLDRWMQGRSALALDSAAMLIRMRGGDALERAEFARLFAIGEPQRGLAAFLTRQSPKS